VSAAGEAKARSARRRASDPADPMIVALPSVVRTPVVSAAGKAKGRFRSRQMRCLAATSLRRIALVP
jgi:hypothetical protein